MIMNQTKSRNHLPLFLILTGFLLVLAWLGLKGWRMAQAIQSLQTRQTQLETLISGGWQNIDPTTVDLWLAGTQTDIETIHRESAIFLPLCPHLGWLPKVGETVIAAPYLLEMANAGISTANSGWKVARPLLEQLQNRPDQPVNPLTLLVQTLQTTNQDLAQAELSFQQLAIAYAGIPNRQALPWQLQQPLNQLENHLPLIQSSFQLAHLLPRLMGADGQPRTYLLIAQNEDELRATGGFISGAGTLMLQNGQILSLDFIDANLVDDWANKPYEYIPEMPYPPTALYELMGLELFLFRDANFWADFPTSATKAMELYTYGRGVELDGVIAIDQQFLQLLIDGTGPIELPDEEKAVSGHNVLNWIRQAWEPEPDSSTTEWMMNRKSFIGILATALRQKLESNFSAIDPIQLAQNMQKAIEAKHLQIYISDPEVAGILANLGWDGHLPQPTQADLLMVADTNMGYNKVNLLVSRNLAYELTLTPEGTAEATLTVTYVHQGTATSNPCQHGIPYSLELTYEQLTNSCYWNYMRLYTPTGSMLLQAQSEPVGSSFFIHGGAWDGEVGLAADPSGLTVFEDFLLLPQGQTVSRQYRYQLPVVVQPLPDGSYEYQLTVVKQAGTDNQSLYVAVTVPAQTQMVQAAGATITGHTVIFNTTLEKDTTFTILYQ